MRRQAAAFSLALLPIVMTGCSLDLNVYETADKESSLTSETAQSAAAPKPIEPPTIHTEGRYRFSAQPDKETLRDEITANNVTTVINFRRDSEMESVPFDEARIIEDLGADYIHIPLGGGVGDEPGYDPEDVDRLAEVLQNSEGNVLLHCASGSRARTIWTAYLIKHEGLSEAEAIERAQRVGQQPSSLDRLLGKPSAYTPPTEEEG